jgi:hypothetical protein
MLQALGTLLLENSLPFLYRRIEPMTRAAMFRVMLIVAGAFVCGATGGWYVHGFWSATEDGRPCRDEVISVDGARGPASCTHAETTSELKDGYLICKCKKK